jgi:hypothetical protein
MKSSRAVSILAAWSARTGRRGARYPPLPPPASKLALRAAGRPGEDVLGKRYCHHLTAIMAEGMYGLGM